MTDVPPAPPPSALFKPAVDEKSIVAKAQALIDSELGHYVTGTNAMPIANLITGLLINISRIANKL
jgi:hypothetical protein